jgi:hypothetical protein
MILLRACSKDENEAEITVTSNKNFVSGYLTKVFSRRGKSFATVIEQTGLKTSL